MSSTREIIHQAIIGRCDVDMRYRNNSGTERFWIVTPIKWTNNSVFLARCYGSDKELTFNVNNVLECGFRDQQDGAVPEMKKAAVALIEVTSIPTGPIATKDKPPSAKTQAEPFDHVHDGDQWSRLVRYYRECLIVENRQQYIIAQDRLQTIDVAPVEARWFMSGTRAIQFDLSDLSQSHPLKRFLRFGLDDDRKQLCVGYPLLALTGGKVAPLIYCQAAIEQREQTVTLRPEAPEISYAALKDLGFSEEEIGEFLNECNQLIADSRSSQLQALEDAMVAKIGELLQINLRWSETCTAPLNLDT